MENMRFYEETGYHTVVALDMTKDARVLPLLSAVANPPTLWCRYGWSAPLASDRTLVTYHAIPIVYMWECCKRISEQQARRLHPELFAVFAMKKSTHS